MICGEDEEFAERLERTFGLCYEAAVDSLFRVAVYGDATSLLVRLKALELEGYDLEETRAFCTILMKQENLFEIVCRAAEHRTNIHFGRAACDPLHQTILRFAAQALFINEFVSQLEEVN